MKISQLLAPTLREDPAEAEVISHKLMVRGGFIRKLAAGIYTFLPLGWKVVHKIENIVREEMNKAGAQEVLLPAVLPSELWKESGRWDLYGPELMRIKDRHDREFCLGPTHEEIITDLVRREVKSYRQLPINFYQIQTKFRDEIRPRFGLMRAREFMMKDAYSFDRDEEGLEKSYQKMYETYCRIFDRCGLKYKVVEADPGVIGGGFSQEFMVLAPTGEDEIAHCTKCDYAASHEMAKIRKLKGESRKLKGEIPSIEKVSTPNIKTIEELEAFLKAPRERMIKTLLHKIGKEVVAVLIRGDHHINETKLKRLLGRDDVVMADAETVEKVSGAPVGFAGPVGLKVKIIADFSVIQIEDGVTGANEADAHLIHVAYGRDYKADIIDDVRLVVEGDPCPKCEGTFKLDRGIEVGHIFKLGTKYSEALKATFLDEKGCERPFIMGCYGIGITRTAAAAIEQNHDENGIKWPIPIAPYPVEIIPVNVSEEKQSKTANKLYEDMRTEKIEVILDDREERVGVKFKDADLIGFPIKIIIGKGLEEGKVEIQLRQTGEKKPVRLDEVISEVKKLCQS